MLMGGLSFRDQGAEIRKKLGVVPEGLGLFEFLTVIENLMAVGPIYGLTQRETRARSGDLWSCSTLCMDGIRLHGNAHSECVRRLPWPWRSCISQMSFCSTNPLRASTFLFRRHPMLLRQLSNDGTTILLTSHILSIVQESADRVLILHEGRIGSDFQPTTNETVVERYFSIVGRPQAEAPDWLSS